MISLSLASATCPLTIKANSTTITEYCFCIWQEMLLIRCPYESVPGPRSKTKRWLKGVSFSHDSCCCTALYLPILANGSTRSKLNQVTVTDFYNLPGSPIFCRLSMYKWSWLIQLQPLPLKWRPPFLIISQKTEIYVPFVCLWFFFSFPFAG